MDESTRAAGRPPLGSLPVLVYDHGLDLAKNRQTAFAVADQSLHTQVVPELVSNYYDVTPHGWVLLVAPGPSPRTRLWDPRSGATVSLPAMEHELPEQWKCRLSDAPTAPSCVVLVLHMAEPRFLYCRAGDAGWSVHDYDIGWSMLPPEYKPPERIVIQQAAAAAGRFYFREAGKLGVVDFPPASTAPPEFSYHGFPRVVFPDGSSCCRGYLVESHGEVFEVYVYLKGRTPEFLTVGVYKIHLPSPGRAATVSKVDDLGDRAFLLSYPNAQLLCSASRYGLKGNRVYFMHNVIAEPDGGLLHVYDMGERSLETVRPCPEMTELLCNPFWMLPTDIADFAASE
ncbi:hypothetical protein ACP70R_038776 [Stipagrostis hirtigluma subsp. patula]